jgi:hypothetical protein
MAPPPKAVRLRPAASPRRSGNHFNMVDTWAREEGRGGAAVEAVAGHRARAVARGRWRWRGDGGGDAGQGEAGGRE